MRSAFRFVLAAVLAGCGSPQDGPKPEENPMPPTATARLGVPPIDADAPARFETATFAVG